MEEKFKRTVTVKQYIRYKALGLLGLIDSGVDPRVRDERLTFVNDINEVQKNKLQEYNVWYAGDADELINFYTRASSIDYNTDPLYNRNKKSYFWAVSSTENDIKRTHSGQPRNIIDTLNAIVGTPRIGVGDPESVLKEVNDRLLKILKDNHFNKLLRQKARPYTLVEGWGAWKINWDKKFRDTPILLYYRANAVDFIYKSNQLIAIVYKDYYQDDKGQDYILFETRRTEVRTIKNDKTGLDQDVPCLIIEKELFKCNHSDYLQPVALTDLPQLKDVKSAIIVKNCSRLLGCPSIYYEDSTEDCYGRSIFTGKIDLFDDLDQCHSQSANAVRRSTVHEYFDSNYLERDEMTGQPVMPKAYDRKYMAFKGAQGADGASNGSTPVQVTQPAINFTQYDQEEQTILINIISGVMSPATLGIDVAKKDNADAQREKEKVTIFTRNGLIDEERDELTDLMTDLLISDELMHKGEITNFDYDIFIEYDEFADASFEAKLETVLTAWQSGIISDDAAIEYLWGKTTSKEKRDRELKFLQKQREMAEEQSQAQIPDENDEEMGEGDMGLSQNPEDQGIFGDLGAENEFNTTHSKPKMTGNIPDNLEEAVATQSLGK